VTLDAMKDFDLLAEFDDEDREALAELLEERSLREGRRIFCEGNEAEGLVLVTSGSVKLEGRRSASAEIVEAPVTLGLLSLIAVGPRECTAFAAEPCELLVLPRTSFRRLMDDHPRTACRLVEGIVDEASGLIRAALDQLAEA